MHLQLKVAPGPFRWRGVVSSSKSIAIRHLVIAEYADGNGSYSADVQTEADDVLYARAALRALSVGEPADCGEGGAVLRFLALRASRIAGVHRLTGTDRLFQRPIEPLIDVLTACGAQASVDDHGLVVESDGAWRLGAPVRVDASLSSQFASAVLLNAWQLDAPLTLNVGASSVSEPYRAMTVALNRRSGMQVEERADASGLNLVVSPEQTVRAGRHDVESDASSAFAVAVAGVMAGGATIEQFPHQGLQPDACFPDILGGMGADVALVNDVLTVSRSGTLRATQVDLGDTPDLFCALAVCCGVADGRSRLRGAPHLRNKESDRIAKTAELLRALGRVVEEHDDGIDVVGRPSDFTDAEPFAFDAASDHRLAMAAGVAALAGARIALGNPQVVSKSFPDFWHAVGISF